MTRKTVRSRATRTKTVRSEERGGRRQVSKFQNQCRQVGWRISFSKNQATRSDRLKANAISNPAKTYWFSLRSPHFCSYPTTINWVSPKYDTDLVSFSQIQWKSSNFLLRSGGFSSNLAKIWCYFAQIEWFCSNLAKKTCSCRRFEPLASYFQLRPTRPSANRVQSNLTHGFLWSATGLPVGNPMSSGRS